MEKHFSTDMPFLRFALNTLAISCLGLFPLLLLYISLTPGFGSMLWNNGTALSRFLRQVLTNGIPVVFTVNYVSFFLYAMHLESRNGAAASVKILLIDLPARVIIFVLLHGVIYFVSADWFGSFGGDHWQALRVVGPTLVRSVFFENISGVYLYATMVSALPLYTSAIERWFETASSPPRWISRLIHKLPGNLAAIGLALALFAIFALILTGAAAMIVKLQSTSL
ncbi:hypothetical protein O2N63_08490 [Aliiroseovarius sp. KMU-50]|uniref:Uncharacterized protein n=1 Tax=Aliiroseovarius salicola TaxID=3009082 RepID=A0ABT4W0T8_9RHOB|nr:hypothetical protein [Aliiroseovarius sp. KMU-50]MDA5094126.1 hypothetical protein [Aliiroseovarius sp. KMU-50]